MKDIFILIFMIVFWVIGIFIIFLNALNKIFYLGLLFTLMVIQYILLRINLRAKLKENEK